MKTILLACLCGLLLLQPAYSAENCFGEIADSAVFLVQNAAVCAAAENACTERDFLLLRHSAKKVFLDGLRILKSGDSAGARPSWTASILSGQKCTLRAALRRPAALPCRA